MIETNELHIWWLSDPASPRLVGKVSLAGSNATFTYAEEWLSAPTAIPLSQDLPLQAGAHPAFAPGTAPGAIDDARPDQWGERVIRLIDGPRRLGLLELLHLAGDARPGALGTSRSSTSYAPATRPAIANLDDIESLHAAAQAASLGEHLSAHAGELLAPGAGLGGARPKGLINIEGEDWIVKFSDRGDDFCHPFVEHVTMVLAMETGVNSCETRLIDCGRGKAVVVRRFDRSGKKRLHVISARTALHAAGLPESYPALASLLSPSDRLQLFRRMTFNILIGNTDDHAQNHALFWDGSTLSLAPAFDLVPTGLGLHYQSMDVGEMGADATLSNAASQANAFGLGQEAAAKVIHDALTVVDGWRLHFASHGVTDQDIRHLANFIGQPHRQTRADQLHC